MKLKRTLLLINAMVLSSSMLSSAVAHESRIVPASTGSIRVTVGFSSEPALEDSQNGLDLFLFTYDGKCKKDPTDFYGNPIFNAAGTGDFVNLTADALYLKNAAPPTGPSGSTPPPGIIKSLQITNKSPLSRVFNDPGHYRSFFRPTNPGGPVTGGAYGFHVYGTVHAKASEYQCEGDPAPTKIPARWAKIDTYWVCSAKGSFTPPAAFGCVQALQPFPGTLEVGYQASQPYPGAGAPLPPTPDH